MDLRRALVSSRLQIGVSEILVFDDGSTDSTWEMVRCEFPEVRIERVSNSLGIIGARNMATKMARGAVVVTIDDDCEFQSPTTAQDAAKWFELENVGAVAIPYVNVHQPSAVRSKASGGDDPFIVAQYTGCASAIRKEVFITLGGYDSMLWRQNEEYDYCSRMLDRGFVTVCSRSEPIVHFEAADRDIGKIVFHGARGNIIYVWRNVPICFVVPHVFGVMWNIVADALRVGHLHSAIRGIVGGVVACVSRKDIRRPMRVGSYMVMRQLRRKSGSKGIIVDRRIALPSQMLWRLNC